MSAFSVNPVTLATLDLLEGDERARVERMKNAWKRYQGTWPDPLKVPEGTPNYNVKANFAREFVNKSVAKLFGDEVLLDLDRELQGRNEDEQYLDAVWQANGKQTFLQKWAQNGCVTGHAFVLLEPDSAGDEGDLPRLVNLEPEIVFPVTDPLDVEKVLRWRIQFNAVDPKSGKPATFRKMIEPDADEWVITDFISYTEQTAGAGPGVWLRQGEQRWEFRWPPIVGNQNLPAPNLFWGESDLTDDRLDLMHSYNMLLSNLNKIVFSDAHKRLFAQGLTGQEESLASWAIGEIKGVPEAAEIKAVDTSADIGPVLEYLDRVKDLLHEQSNVPAVSVGKVDSLGALAGVALEILYEPLAEMTKVKRGTYGDAINILNRRVLELAGREPQDTVFGWPRFLPVDEKQEAETANQWHKLGVSGDTLMERSSAKFDPEQEKRRRAERQAEMAALMPQNEGTDDDGDDNTPQPPQGRTSAPPGR